MNKIVDTCCCRLSFPFGHHPARLKKPPTRDGSLGSHVANRVTPSKIPRSNVAEVDHSYDYYDPSFYQYDPSQDQPLPQPFFNPPIEHQEPPIHRLGSMSGAPIIPFHEVGSVAATPVAEIYGPQPPSTREANETNVRMQYRHLTCYLRDID